MLLLHEMSRGHLQAASNFLTIACRTVFALGGHTVSVPLAKGLDCVLTLRERESRYVRMLFWYCYTLDKTISLHMGQPAVISDDLCDLRLSESTQQRYFESYPRQAIELQADSRDTLETFLYRRLSIIKSKAIQKLYSPVSLQMSSAKLLHSIRKLDEELEGWRSSIPAELLLVSSVQWPNQNYQDLHQLGSMRQIELQLDYYYVLAIVHCAIGRCMADINPAEPEGILLVSMCFACHTISHVRFNDPFLQRPQAAFS
ncbi:hypothetical protein LMH87_004829 [Akanthomyces muscarius]|uniref:Xylanolytic transcriptional activator regulatory domain-containing protein n=1 Tax=Akanthomyces muscarius TaxID=2231603 RepID=A0A9W8Q4U3_AKAMU|nr:hypothetical protein LMH87_004829 [Akanthomyces muscarius]KAJ4145998.1 hypothetical protein LMH87_004829 [Akanthomyces muscarius]